MDITPPKVGIVILNYNSCEDTLACLEAVRRSQGGERRVWVVDNGSEDGSADAIPPRLREDEVWLPTGSNLGYAGGNNAGIRQALAWGAAYVLVLNPDCRVEPDFLPYLVRALEAVPKAGAACPLVLSEDGETIQSLGGSISLWTGRCDRRLYGRPAAEAGSASWSVVDWPHGSCMLIRRELFEEVGLLNEAYFLYYEEVELALRARREGWVALAIPNSRVRHRDTTADGVASPVVSFYGTRNQAWVVAQYGRLWHRCAFIVLSCYVRWPVKALARLARGRFRAAWAVLRGGWAGQFSKAWNQGGPHLAVPLKGRPLRIEPLP